MYKLPEDVVLEIKRKHPNIINIERVIDDTFNEIVEKTFKDGSCQIRNLGKFISFQSFSTRTNDNVAKFKFYISQVFKNKIKNDKYLLESLPIKAQVPFTNANKEKCGDLQHEIKLANVKAREDASKESSKKSKERLAKHEILAILEKK